MLQLSTFLLDSTSPVPAFRRSLTGVKAKEANLLSPLNLPWHGSQSCSSQKHGCSEYDASSAEVTVAFLGPSCERCFQNRHHSSSVDCPLHSSLGLLEKECLLQRREQSLLLSLARRKASPLLQRTPHPHYHVPSNS